MASALSTILRGVNRRANSKLNILCLNDNEKLQTTMADTGHNFFFLYHPQIPSWDTEIGPIPKNCYLLGGNDIGQQLSQDINFDLIICQNRMTHFQLMPKLAKQLGCPMLVAEYSLSSPDMNPYHVEALANQNYNHNVFESDFLANSWGFDEEESEISIIPQGIDTKLFDGWEGGDKKILTVVNRYQEEDKLTGFGLWKAITSDLPTNPWGKSNGISTQPKDVRSLIQLYRKASVFLNTSEWKSCPIALLEAMSVGCPVVTTATTIIPEIIENGVNGYISNDEEELRSYLKELLENPIRGKELGSNGRQAIIDKFNISTVADMWNVVFKLTIDNVSCSLKE